MTSDVPIDPLSSPSDPGREEHASPSHGSRSARNAGAWTAGSAAAQEAAAPGQGRDDILQLIRRDHRLVTARLQAVADAPQDARAEPFAQLVRLLVGHEVAEEVAVYPALREDAPKGDGRADAQAAARTKEQADAEQHLDKMSGLATDSPEFADALSQLQAMVSAHAASEEAEVFPLIEELQSAERRIGIGLRYQRAFSSAPTHPHPHAPDARIVGPVLSLFDRARDALKGTPQG